MLKGTKYLGIWVKIMKNIGVRYWLHLWKSFMIASSDREKKQISQRKKGRTPCYPFIFLSLCISAGSTVLYRHRMGRHFLLFQTSSLARGERNFTSLLIPF